MRAITLTCLFALGSAAAQAQEPMPPAAPASEPEAAPAAETAAVAPEHHEVALIGLKAGGFFPQPFTPLSTNFVVGLEAGFVLPVYDRRLVIAVGAAYTQPPADGTEMDSRIGNGTYNWSITQRELSFDLSFIFRFRYFGDKVVPYAEAGPKLYLVSTKANGASNGESFGEYTEQSTQIGGLFAAGVDIKLGPGTLLLELDLATSKLDHKITGDASTGALEARLGYRFWL